MCIEEIPHVLWAHRTMIKSRNGDTPFSLTYRTKAVILAKIGMPTLRTAKIDMVQNGEALEINHDLLEERRDQAAICKAISKKQKATQRWKNITTQKSATQASDQETLCTGTMMSAMQMIAESLALSGKDRTKTKAVILAEIGMPTLRTAKIDMVQNGEALEINHDLLEERRDQAAICIVFFLIMGSIDDIKSILTQSALDAMCEKYHIPRTVHHELAGRNSRIHNSPTGKIGVYTRFFHFANYRISLYNFLVDVLQYFQINLSQLSVIAAAKISHFEILCRVHNFVLTVGNFHIFYVNSKNKGWTSFSKRSDTGPVCHTRPLDSLKHRNHHFFWVDAFVFPLTVSCHNNKTLRKDPHPTPAKLNADVCNYLADNPAPFKKFLKPFLCFVGISQYYELDDNYYPTFLTDDDEEMDLFAFMHHVDPIKVRIGERKVREGEVPLLELTKGRVVPLSGVNDQRDANVQGVGDDDVNEESGDAVTANQVEEGDHAIQDEGANIFCIDDEVLASVDDRAKGTLPVEVGVAAVATLPFITSSVSLTPEHEGGGHADSVTRPNMHIQRLAKRACTEPVPRSIFRDSASTGEANEDVAGPSHPTALQHDYEQLFIEFNVGATRQTCLSFKEAEAAKVIRLRGQVATVEVAEAARASELDGLKERTMALEGQAAALYIKAASLESEKDKVIDQVSALKGTCSGLHDEGLTDVSAYDPSAEANFVSVVNALRVVDFPLLAQLASQKDASIVEIIDLLYMEGLAAETQEAKLLQPSPEQLMLPIYRSEDQVVIGETSLSFSLDVVHSYV
nr:transposase (putative), gypsy type [Tanacetum cinerariifolium]